MENIKTTVEGLSENAVEMLETYYKLAIVNVTEKSVNAGSVSIVSLAVLFMVILVLLFGGIGFSIFLNNVLQSNISGYFIVAGLYILLILLLLALRNKVVLPFLRNFIIKKVYE